MNSSMNEDGYTLVEIHSVEEDLLVPWLELYETAFPPSERHLVADVVALLKDIANGLVGDHHFVALTDAQGRLAGMAWHEYDDDARVALLGYLATAPAARGQGLGSWFYQQILRGVDPRAEALLLEVEIPENSGSEAERRLATRRIEFYRRLGARLLEGIHYLQSVGPHQAPIPMHILVHPLRPLTAVDAFRIAKSVWGDWVEQEGSLRLV